MGGQAYQSRWEATRALQSINDSKSDSQVDNGSGWCLLCLWMERLQFPWLWAAVAQQKKSFMKLKIRSHCFLNTSLKISCSWRTLQFVKITFQILLAVGGQQGQVFICESLVCLNVKTFIYCSVTPSCCFHKILIREELANNDVGSVTKTTKERRYVNIFSSECGWVEFDVIFTDLCVSKGGVSMPAGRFFFWLHLRLYREVRGHGQQQNNIPVFMLMFAWACLKSTKEVLNEAWGCSHDK